MDLSILYVSPADRSDIRVLTSSLWEEDAVLIFRSSEDDDVIIFRCFEDDDVIIFRCSDVSACCLLTSSSARVASSALSLGDLARSCARPDGTGQDGTGRVVRVRVRVKG